MFDAVFMADDILSTLSNARKDWTLDYEYYEYYQPRLEEALARLQAASEEQYHECSCRDDHEKTTVDNVSLNTPAPNDPNAIVGSLGVGDPVTERFLKPGEEDVAYTIYFENKSNAETAAQEIRVTETLDPALDWSTFRLGEVAFNNQIDNNLSGYQSGTSEVKMNGTNYYVRTEASFDPSTGKVSWYLRIVDKTTADEWPTDLHAGILPPNDDTFRGEGHVTYRVNVRKDATPGTLINASASIIFDYNDPIVTDPPWSNMVAQVASVKINGDVEGDGADLELIVGQPYGELPTPQEHVGLTFVGWFTGPNGTGRQVTAESMVEVGDTALYAYYVTKVICLTLTPNSTTRGSVSGGGTYKIGATATLKATAKTGNAFAGWFTDKACTKPLNPKGYDNRSPTVKVVVPEDDTTIYAKFVSKDDDKAALKFTSATKKLATTPAKATAGSKFSLKIGASSLSLPTFSAMGLPKGLSINKATGEISGVGTVPGAYTAKVTLTSAAGNKITQNVKITVSVPSWAKGTFYGTAKPDGKTLSYQKFTVTATGKVSGKVNYKGKAYSFTSAYKSCTATKATFAPSVKVGKKTFKPGTVTVKTQKLADLSLVEAANSKGTFAAQKKPNLVKKGKALAKLVGKTFTFTKKTKNSRLTKSKDKLSVKLAEGDAAKVTGVVGGKKLTAISWVTLVSSKATKSGSEVYTLYVDIIDASLKYERTLVIKATVSTGGVKATAAFAK